MNEEKTRINMIVINSINELNLIAFDQEKIKSKILELRIFIKKRNPIIGFLFCIR